MNTWLLVIFSVLHNPTIDIDKVDADSKEQCLAIRTMLLENWKQTPGTIIMCIEK